MDQVEKKTAPLSMAALRKIRRKQETPGPYQIMRILASGKYGGNGNTLGKRYDNKTGAGENARRLRAMERRALKNADIDIKQ